MEGVRPRVTPLTTHPTWCRPLAHSQCASSIRVRRLPFHRCHGCAPPSSRGRRRLHRRPPSELPQAADPAEETAPGSHHLPAQARPEARGTLCTGQSAAGLSPGTHPPHSLSSSSSSPRRALLAGQPEPSCSLVLLVPVLCLRPLCLPQSQDPALRETRVRLSATDPQLHSSCGGSAHSVTEAGQLVSVSDPITFLQGPPIPIYGSVKGLVLDTVASKAAISSAL